ncbi:hypothetical protein BROUX41_004312 [Berkeleyomyces rouxiae]
MAMNHRQQQDGHHQHQHLGDYRQNSALHAQAPEHHPHHQHDQHVILAGQSQLLGYSGHRLESPHDQHQHQQMAVPMQVQIQPEAMGNALYMSGPHCQQEQITPVQSALNPGLGLGRVASSAESLGLVPELHALSAISTSATSTSATLASPPGSHPLTSPTSNTGLDTTQHQHQHQLQMQMQMQIQTQPLSQDFQNTPQDMHHNQHQLPPAPGVGVLYANATTKPASSSAPTAAAATDAATCANNSNQSARNMEPQMHSLAHEHEHGHAKVDFDQVAGPTASYPNADIGDYLYAAQATSGPQSNVSHPQQHIASANQPNLNHLHLQPQVQGIIPPSADMSMTHQRECPAGPIPPDNSTCKPSSADGNPNTSGMSQAIAAACLSCRAKHLKCNGQTPCSRCTANQSECVYIASRRGYKGPRAKPAANNPNKRRAESELEETSSLNAGTATTTSTFPMVMGHNSGVPVTGSMGSLANMGDYTASTSTGSSNFASSSTDGSSPYSASATPMPAKLKLTRSYDTSHLLLSPTAAAAAAAALGTGLVPAQTSTMSVADRCLDSFYHHFFAAHPFVLPKEHLLRLAKDGQINHLLMAMRYIGSLFISVGSAGVLYFDEAMARCYDVSTPRDGFLIQAMMLLLLGLDGNCQRQQSKKILLDVEKLAIEVNLHTRPFATMHGRGIPVLEESWRRTWWDLYVIDGMIAGVHRETNFALYDILCDVALPCEEDQYANETIPTPMYLQDLEDADFSGEDREFSSFAYRIASGRILGKMMRTPEFFGPEDENIDKIETLLTNWRLHLPPSKQSSLSKNLQLDEMMFQAIMMNRTISIMLHQPFSQLDSSSTRNVNSCAAHQPVTSGDDFNAHTRHTISSANDISKMITHRVPLLSHTHFFTCVITHSSIIHLSKWALYFVPYDDDDLRQQIRLHIGALNKLSQVWKAASTACGQVRSVAQEIYRGKKAQSQMPGFWMGLTPDQVITSMANDESMMTEIDALTAAPVIVDTSFTSVDAGGQ